MHPDYASAHYALRHQPTGAELRREEGELVARIVLRLRAGGGGLRWRTRKPLANRPLLRWGEVGARRFLGSGEADAAENRKGNCACANELTHDGLLTC